MIMHASEIPEVCGVLESTEEFFGENSPLGEAKKHGGPEYEQRPQQVEMARRVAATFEERHNLCIEAPTGVGKSFAYLIPAVYFSQHNDYPVIISTETISLQEQLIAKDIPFLGSFPWLFLSPSFGTFPFCCMLLTTSCYCRHHTTHHSWLRAAVR